MKKTTGIIALAAASALVLSGCAANNTEETATSNDDTIVDSDNTTNDEPNTDVTDETPEPATLPAESLRIAPGEYTYEYEFLDSYDGQTGYLATGIMMVGADGSCDFDMQILDFSDFTGEGDTLEPTLLAAKTNETLSAMSYSQDDLNEDTFTVPDTRTVLAEDSEFWTTWVDADPYLGMAMNNSVSKYHGPCFFLQFPELLTDHPDADTLVGETETGGYVFEAEKINAYESDRLAETADALFPGQANADELTAAWIASQTQYAPTLGDPGKVIITETEDTQDATGMVIRLSSLTEDVARGAFTIRTLENDSEFPTMIFLPQSDSTFGLSEYGASIQDELLSE